MEKSKPAYLLKYHAFYAERIAELKARVKELRGALSPEEFARHEIVKLALRIRDAEKEIAANPKAAEYLLHDELRKFRRYKRGLGRYRLFFCFSDNPPIIVFLYLNSAETPRQEGGRGDPYEVFKAMLRRGEVSRRPDDPKIQKWIERR
ncbi:MAG TPA: type II toxin-antitoxin system YhaV family toxin [Elusimicrobiota bacterium]|nr:type II toxin-antitoxin system YhaV family toxin [Elusimicrobiota bacterium]